jgi:hypothetical protein
MLVGCATCSEKAQKENCDGQCLHANNLANSANAAYPAIIQTVLRASLISLGQEGRGDSEFC